MAELARGFIDLCVETGSESRGDVASLLYREFYLGLCVLCGLLNTTSGPPSVDLQSCWIRSQKIAQAAEAALGEQPIWASLFLGDKRVLADAADGTNP